MSKIHQHMSIPKFMDILDLDQLRMVENMAKQRVEKIVGEDRVTVWCFSSGSINEGFYGTEEEAKAALKNYVINGKYDTIDKLKVFSFKEYPFEVERLLKYTLE